MPSTVIRGVQLADEPMSGQLVDIHVADGQIVAVHPAARATEADSIIDGGGRLAMPGFIDAHAHAEGAVFDDEVQLAMLRQGVTSVVVGNDGVSFAPAPGPTAEWASDYFIAINGEHPDGAQARIADLRAGYNGRTRVNVATLVPHGNLRHAVIGGSDRPATAGELDEMVSLLEQGLSDGACGLSTGLEYQPGGYADVAELTALARVVAEHRLPHVSHMRGYEGLAVGAMAELAQIAHDSGVATHISHLHGPDDQLVAALDSMQAEGLDVTFDSYPYLRGASILSMVALPDWVPLADPAQAVALLRRPDVQERLHAEHLPQLEEVWPRITMAHVPGKLAWAEGLGLMQVADRLRLSPAQTVVELLISTELRAGCIFAQPPTNSEASVRTLLGSPGHIGSSDAIYSGGKPHPRGWGAFARFLAEHVRRLSDWTWAESQWHLSGAAAARFCLHDRGALAPGMAADIALIDPDAVQDNADYETPRTLATGVDDVLVNGTPVLTGGMLTPERTGRALRPPKVTR
ncbi:N-acyl-D-amino-acid deacylase family protein [Ruania alba]|uniref:N-acyl-D-amino-acid deacylase n=1 Tax=Ruania alba TaxID=648782 RepID=A0A1H5NE98_9MICO|nr:amidohydrolase family protein [Ruania alba]SEE99969.1 N-acyl-D-amino-acid deacylase [Ruania alba]